VADLEDYFVEDSDEAALWHSLLVLQVEREEEKQLAVKRGTNQVEATKEVQVPKPLTCEIVGNEANATFDRDELRQYLANTSDIVMWVEDAEGNRAPMRVDSLREFLA
jgi:hypothetical protein